MRVVGHRRRARRPRRPRCACRAPGYDVDGRRAARRARRPRLPAARRGLHLGHGPVADDDAVGARGDVRGGRARPPRARSTLRRLDPLYRIRWAGEDAPLRLRRRPASACATQVAQFSAARRRARRRRSSPRCAPIYEQGDPRRRAAAPFLRAARLRRGSCRRWLRLGAAAAAARASSRASSSTRACARRSPSTRCSSAATRTACRRSTPRSSTSRCSTAAGTPTAASTRSSRRWPARSTSAAASPSRRSSTPAGASPACGCAGGERIAADVVVSNADVLRTHELLGRPRAAPAAARRRCPASCSTSARTGRSTRLLHHTLLVGDGYREFIRDVTRGRGLPHDASRPTCTRPRAPSRRWRRPAATRSRVLLPVPNLRAGIDWAREADGLRDALRRRLRDDRSG